MENIRRFIGVDISKHSFDACILSGNGSVVVKHYEFNANDIEEFASGMNEADVCVMEATGTYHLRLAMTLYEFGKNVVVANPLSVSHFSKMRMNRVKTDRQDAVMLAEYAKMNEGELHKFTPDDPVYVEAKQLLALLDLYQKHMTQMKNQEEAFSYAYVQSKEAMSSIKIQRKNLDKQIERVEKDIEDIIDKHNHDDFQRLQEIPGIGKKTAAVLIATTSDMKKFDNYRQVCSYFGLSPRTYDSGSSVHGKARICKKGMGRIRHLLYVCSWSAIRFNPACRSMYERLVGNGKPKMVALVAIAHKLIKIAFSMIKNQTHYDPDFLLKRPCILT